MVRIVWVGVAFVCGIMLGVVGARMTGGPRTVAALPAPASMAPTATTAAPANPATPSAAKFGSVPPGAGVTPATANNPVLPPMAGIVAATGPGPIDGPAPHPIDVGAAFHQLVDRPSYPGFPNEFGDAHRALERETRDDSWSYAIEAEIQNSLTAEVSAGNLKVEFLECRTTVCEVRLSATDAHSDALNAWSESQNSTPWYQHLQSVGMSMSATNGGSQGLWLYRRPPTK
jgi:hypothetical protein